jgi:hypothetical protein
VDSEPYDQLLPFEPHVLLIGSCARCGTSPLIIEDPDTAPSVLIHQQTHAPVDPSGKPVRRGDPLVSREPLCPGCLYVCRRAIQQGQKVSWPVARHSGPPS